MQNKLPARSRSRATSLVLSLSSTPRKLLLLKQNLKRSLLRKNPPETLRPLARLGVETARVDADADAVEDGAGVDAGASKLSRRRLLPRLRKALFPKFRWKLRSKVWKTALPMQSP